MVLKVNLNEIDRCRPFFIGILGDRYGWIPPENRMKDAEREKGFESKLKNKSITALEIEYGVLSSKEHLKHSFFFFRDPLPYDQMPEDIRSLYSDEHNPSLKGFDAKKLLDDLKNEIIKAVGKQKVFTYKAEWNGSKVTGLEEFKEKVVEVLWKELGIYTKELEIERPKTWEEEEQRYLDDFIDDKTISFIGREDVIQDLKKFALNTSDNDIRGKCITGELGSGKSALFAMLHRELQNEYIILLAHAAGISLRSISLLNMLTIWVKQLAKELKVDVSEQLKEKNKTDIKTLQLRTGLKDEQQSERSRFEDLKMLFTNLLSQAAQSKRVVVLVDSLNQFENTIQAKYANWLPDIIPENSRFIFTSIPGEEVQNLSNRRELVIEQLSGISMKDAGTIVEALCARSHKMLPLEVVNILFEKKRVDGTNSYSNPLWLTIAVDQFLRLDEDDFARMKDLEVPADQKITQLLMQTAKDVPAEIGAWVFVSHSHHDMEKVRKIRNELEKQGHNPLLFYLKCLVGDDERLPELIREEIKAREWFILCDSPNSRNSRWVQEEVNLIRSMKGKIFETVDLSKDLSTELHKLIRLSRRATVFLSYAWKDYEVAGRIRRSLINHDFSVVDSSVPPVDWTHIQTAIDDAVERGFVLILLSPESLSNKWCKYQINYALTRASKTLHSNIIPIVISQFEMETLKPFGLNEIQWFDLTTGKLEERIEELIENLKTRKME